MQRQMKVEALDYLPQEATWHLGGTVRAGA